MSSALRTKGIAVCSSLLVACLLFTSCSANHNQTVINNPETTSTSSSDLADEALNMTQAPIDEAYELTLLSSLPDRGIYLYSKESDGVVLKVGDSQQDYDWLYMTPMGIPPIMQVSDYNADGKEELSIICYVGSGTGVSVEELHMIDISEEPFKHDMFSADDYDAQLHQAVGFTNVTQAGELIGELTIGTKTYTTSLKELQSEDYGKINEDIIWRTIVRFSSDNNKLTAQFGVGVSSENFSPPTYIGVVNADVDYQAGEYILKNLWFEENQETQ